MMADEEQRFRHFFRTATTFDPYAWQVKAAVDGLPEILPIPTGLGKTEGSVLAWAWRCFSHKESEPLHLIYCLPMRSLVRQTTKRLESCFARLKSWDPSINVRVHRLIGGDTDYDWAATPDHPWVLVGTQDMLLSRALNRGYGMSRFDWPVHFGLLNQDCHWVVDEVQLMGPGLWATAQLDWMRRKRFPGLKSCRTTWMSATMGAQFLETTDRKKDGCDKAEPFDADVDGDSNNELRQRRTAHRPAKLHQSISGKKAKSPAEQIKQIASEASATHTSGTLTLIVCNTVKSAQVIYQEINAKAPKILLTSRFRADDRSEAEELLRKFEDRRSASNTGRIEEGDPGLICVSTQVIEAGIDISSHRLFTEHAPWPSLVQRLGRLNRDGNDNEPLAIVWKLSPDEKRKHEGEDWIGPYRKSALDCALSLLKTFAPLSEQMSATAALAALQTRLPKEMNRALTILPEPCPRALDVHGLFSTEPDLHGGFTDVSRFVRGAVPDADVAVFWRDWRGTAPPSGKELVGDFLKPDEECCMVMVGRLQTLLKEARAHAWIWNDDTECWELMPPGDIRPGMTVMLRGDAGGYSKSLGWTGKTADRLNELQPPGPGRALRDDKLTDDGGYWASLASHLSDARMEATRICDAVGIEAKDPKLSPVRAAVIEAVGLHDLGKAHPDWQCKVPESGPVDVAAKFPKVLRVETSRSEVEKLKTDIKPWLVGAYSLTDETVGTSGRVRLRWALKQPIDTDKFKNIRELPGVFWAAHKAFRPGLRHEAASALAMWQQYKELDGSRYPALAVYLCAAHHGKVRTVLKALAPGGTDVFGVGRTLAVLHFDGHDWPMDFSIASDGADGSWTDSGFAFAGPGWTGIVADLLGPWDGHADLAWTGAVPKDEPRALGPFTLAWLEALVRVSDWRSSRTPSKPVWPGDPVE